MLSEPLTTVAATKLLGEIVRTGNVVFRSHALDEMAKDDLSKADALNVLRAGAVSSGRIRERLMAVSRVDAADDLRGGVSERNGSRHRDGVARKGAAMTCMECGGVLTTTRDTIKYDSSGLPGVTLQNIEVRRCAACGEREIVIPRMEELHRLIAHTIIRKPSRLTPHEIRFLRKWLGWSGADFARAMGTAPETVSRWESGATPMGVQADKLLRSMILIDQPIKDYYAHDLAQVAGEDAKPLKAKFTADRRGWKQAA